MWLTIISLVAKLGGGLLGFAEKASSDAVKKAGIDADVAIAKTNANVELAREGTKRQLAKMNWPVFWVLVTVMLGPGAIHLWALSLYNILWHAHGIWPQPWTIAEFPPQSKVWVDLSIRWLFDPVGAPTTVATAGVVGWLTGKAR